VSTRDSSRRRQRPRKARPASVPASSTDGETTTPGRGRDQRRGSRGMGMRVSAGPGTRARDRQVFPGLGGTRTSSRGCCRYLDRRRECRPHHGRRRPLRGFRCWWAPSPAILAGAGHPGHHAGGDARLDLAGRHLLRRLGVSTLTTTVKRVSRRPRCGRESIRGAVCFTGRARPLGRCCRWRGFNRRCTGAAWVLMRHRVRDGQPARLRASLLYSQPFPPGGSAPVPGKRSRSASRPATISASPARRTSDPSGSRMARPSRQRSTAVTP